jgi:MFS transporter, putative metabolite:H+ symporter
MHASQLYGSLDRSKLTPRHVIIYIAGTIGHISDGFDLTLLGFILPLIIAEFHLTPALAGALGSSAFLGMLVGAVLIGALSDRIGRKRSFAASLIVYIVFGAACAVAPSYGWLYVFRLLEGIGLGAEVVVVFVYLAELLPANRRGLLLTLSACLWQLSALLAAVLTVWITPVFGWRAMFIVGAIIGLIVFVFWVALPESVRSLVQRGKMDEAEATVRNISTVDPSTLPVAQGVEQKGRTSVLDILRGRYLGPTLTVWLMGFSFGFMFFGTIIWLPSILLKQGFGFGHSLIYSGAIIGCGAIGNAVGGIVMDRIGRKTTLAILYFVGGVLLYIWGLMTTQASILALGAAAGFFAFGAFGASFTYGTELYPTRYRGTGAGWMGAWQRIGGFVAPTVVGFILGAGLSIHYVFGLMGALYIVTAIVIMLFLHETAGKTLEQIEGELSAGPTHPVAADQRVARMPIQ